MIILILIFLMLIPVYGEYKPDWEDFARNPIPEWVKDAKFGVYTHWGVYSVPAHGGPDYIRNLYSGPEIDEKGTYSYHIKKYGDLSKVGYKDLIPKFTAPKFNADEWVGLMHEAGAKFGGICLVHHDGFLLWDSKVSRWNSKNMGPKRDIYGEIARAVRKYDDMKLLATFHHARTFGYATGNLKKMKVTDEMKKTWDLFDPQYNDFYWNKDIGATVEKFSDDWKAKIKEVIDNYQPDMIWFDGLQSAMRGMHPPEPFVKEVIAYYYNESEKQGQDVTVCNKHAGQFNFPEAVGFRCYEGGRDMPLHVGPWFLSDRAISYPWAYVNDKNYKDKADYHVKILVDIVSRGGIYLLSLTPMGDGSSPEQEKEIMRDMGKWMKVNGEAIYSTRPWVIYAEGPTVFLAAKIKKDKEIKYWDYRREAGAQDIRFTVNKNATTIYAISLGWPEKGKVIVTSLKEKSAFYSGKIKSVSMLGSKKSIKWAQTEKGLEVDFPKEKPCEYAYSLKINLDGKTKLSETRTHVEAMKKEPKTVSTKIVKEKEIITPIPLKVIDGQIILDARDAKMVSDKMVKSDKHNNKITIQRWGTTKEYIHWNIPVTKSGMYKAYLCYSTIKPKSKIVFKVGDKSIAAEIEGTGDWRKYDEISIGEIEIGKTDNVRVELHPAVQGWDRINFSYIRLVIK